ncbi:hypothetical protein [Clostridium sp. HBUAS56017]|uniref:hypothetical protein n=1 Tax=Clostridium sp. HBUAS56017 TaxID=2571128 RepID=UPI0011786138|nr:hypothetical protein [Clostridium sp. HBUAS56017]
MKIKETDFKISYSRHIESMGKGLVLFKVKADKKAIGQNYHCFYEDKKKPPLDIAINPKNNLIEYVSFFAQDEKIKQTSVNLNIKFINKNIEFYGFDMDLNYPEERCMKNFKLHFDKGNIYLLSSEQLDDLIGYEVNHNNYILFDKNNTFYGLLFSDITDAEINEMKQSEVL